MKLFITAALALLPALGSAHCVAQRVRINGAVRLLVYQHNGTIAHSLAGQWSARWYPNSQLQQSHSERKRRKLCLQQRLQDPGLIQSP